MKKLIAPIKNIQFTEKSVPWMLLVACILAFGLLITNLGYFQDDWNYVFNFYTYGEKGLLDFLQHDGRPYAIWVYDLGFRLLGYAPLGWHLATLIIRWFVAVIFWMIFKALWPQAAWQNFVAALFFVLYPFFTLQPLAVAYSLHWTGYLLLGLSLFFMIIAQKRHFWTYTALAIIFQVAHLLTLEYFAGIEFLRPILLWFMLSSSSGNNQKRFLHTIRQWLPYFLVFSSYFFWRGFIYQAATEGRNTPTGLIALMQDPITTIITNLNHVISDVALILITSWYKLLTPEYLDFRVSENRIIFILTVLSFSIFLLYFKQRKEQENPETPVTSRQMLFVGVMALFLGLLPAYGANFIMYQKIEPWNTRFGLGSLFGAALIITIAIESIVKVSKTRWIIIAMLTALLIGWHLHYTNDYRWAWEKQVNFYRQLYIRAPEITPNTAILTEGEFLMYMGDYPTSYGVNLVYTPQENNFIDQRKAYYWFFPLVEFYNKFEQHLNGEPFSKLRAGLVFEGDPEGSFTITFEPGLGQCLWVMRPEYAKLKSLSQPTRQMASISFVERIKQAPENPDSFLLKYLYTHPEQDWCYYYEKADLAYQYEEWDNVIRLWKSANQEGLKPQNGFEYLPFIEAYAHTGDWKTAQRMTRVSQKTMQGIDPLLCGIWSKLDNDTPNSTVKEGALLLIRENLICDQE
jgi:hypothetical protein